MCSASRPERGAGREDGINEEEVTEGSAWWMFDPSLCPEYKEKRVSKKTSKKTSD
jgi:hypothetical protein